MTHIRSLTISAALGLLVAGCGNTANDPDGGHELGDGHVQTGCNIDADCDDGNACHTGKCNIVTHVCSFDDKQCTPADSCSTATCDPSDGTCKSTPANDNGSCTTTSGAAGTCMTGFCMQIPSCFDSVNSFLSLSCATGFSGADDNDNDPFNVGSGATHAVNDYGNCATGETAPEVAYPFSNTTASDQLVTVHLELQNLGAVDAGTPDGGTPAETDLDLIILEGTQCNGQVACVNPARAGGGFQGITANTANETVTFTAKANTSYFIVVDGKGSASYHIEIQACGACQPTPTNTLSCNQSMSVNGDTSQGTSALASYTCGGNTLPGAGSEQIFFFTPVGSVAQQVRTTVTNPSSAVTLAAIGQNSSLQCDAAMSCLAGANAPAGTSTSITFSADRGFSATPNHYFVVVDAPMSGTNATYGLQFDCLPSCSHSGDLDCSSNKTVSGNNGSASASSVSAWGPTGMACGGMTNLSGPEYVYLFAKPATTSKPTYRFTLAATSDNKHLGLVILDAGDANPTSCDPATTCAMTTPVTVTATATTLASTGTYVSAGPMSSDGGTDGKTAVVDLQSTTAAAHYYWVVVDGVTGDVSDFALSIDSGCM
jgi:hypothetical protein